MTSEELKGLRRVFLWLWLGFTVAIYSVFWIAGCNQEAPRMEEVESCDSARVVVRSPYVVTPVRSGDD